MDAAATTSAPAAPAASTRQRYVFGEPVSAATSGGVRLRCLLGLLSAALLVGLAAFGRGVGDPTVTAACAASLALCHALCLAWARTRPRASDSAFWAGIAAFFAEFHLAPPALFTGIFVSLAASVAFTGRTPRFGRLPLVALWCFVVVARCVVEASSWDR